MEASTFIRTERRVIGINSRPAASLEQILIQANLVVEATQRRLSKEYADGSRKRVLNTPGRGRPS